MSLGNPLIIAVTGSAGKTTAKSMIASVLRERWSVFESKDNCNTSANTQKHAEILADGDYQAAVLEYGMGHSGVIARHCSFIQPDYSVITNVGTAHVGNFDNGVQGVAKAKSEIISGMKPDGILFLNKDNVHSGLLRTGEFEGTIMKVSIMEPSDYQALNVRYEVDGMAFEVELGGRTESFHIPVHGTPHVYNALFAIAVSDRLGFGADAIRAGLEHCRRPDGRMIVHRLPDNITVIDDTCHATFEAMKAAIDVMSVLAPGPRIAVLGMMPQLGDFLTDAHYELGNYVAESKTDWVFTFEANTRHIRRGALDGGMPKENMAHFTEVEQLCERLLQYATPNTTILVKGAKRLQMNRIVNELLDRLGKRQ